MTFIARRPSNCAWRHPGAARVRLTVSTVLSCCFVHSYGEAINLLWIGSVRNFLVEGVQLS